MRESITTAVAVGWLLFLVINVNVKISSAFGGGGPVHGLTGQQCPDVTTCRSRCALLGTRSWPCALRAVRVGAVTSGYRKAINHCAIVRGRGPFEETTTTVSKKLRPLTTRTSQHLKASDRGVPDVTEGTRGGPVFDALIEQFISPMNGNVTATVEEYLDLCDHALLTFLQRKIASVGEHTETGAVLKKVEAEINMAMQRRLAAADANLRAVLDFAPDIKKMESNMRALFREGKLDMAFMVMINMNLQRAKEAEGAENAVMLLTHLNAFINALQDERLNPEVKLLRILLRTDCDGVRKSMLQERLQLPNHDIFLERPPDKGKVQPHLLQQAITDMIVEVEELNQAIDDGLTTSLQGLRAEINEVVKGNQRPGPFKESRK